MEPMIGQQLGNSGDISRRNVQSQRYQIKSLLGKQRGRRTFLAENVETKAPVVLKLILFGPDFTWEDLKLFEREAETLKSLDHAAIPTYLDSFEVETELGKGFVLVQTYIEARSLQDWVTSGRRFSEADLKELAQSVLVILQYLHSRHPAVVHRDIKPSNILLGDRTAHSIGKVYLVDFGSVQVAHHGGTITVVGTYGYMPPEQFGGRATPASDLYSLGATLVYLATGQHPADFVESSLEEAVSNHLKLSTHFKRWVRHLVRSNAAQRTPSAALAFHTLSDTELAKGDLQSSTESKLIKKVQTVAVSSRSSQAIASSIANGAFRVQSTPQTLTLQLYQHRIRERLQIQAAVKRPVAPAPGKLLVIFALGTILFVALLIVAASGSSAGVTLLFSAFFVGLIIFFLSKPSGHNNPELSHIAIIVLTKASDASIYVTVEGIPASEKETATKGATRPHLPHYWPTQFTNVPLRAVRIRPDAFGVHARFVFLESQRRRQPGISISGSKREIKSLIRYIGEWDNSIVGQTGENFIQDLSPSKE